MEYKNIEKKLTEENFIGSGKEVTAYKIDNKAVKIFHKERTSKLKIISQDGLIKLTKLKLHCFNNPKELIYDNNKLVGYIEDYIEDKELNIEKLSNNLDSLHEDIITLSKNGFTISDIQYNYLSNKDDFKFNDMTSYSYINIDNIRSDTGKKFMLEKIYHDNINTINIFLIGLLEFDAYHKGQNYELTKTNKAVMYNLENCKDIYYGEYIKRQSPKKKR